MKKYSNNLNRYSRIITQNRENGAAQAMLYALGLNTHDLQKPQVGVCSMWYKGNPCNSKLNILSNHVSNSLNKKNYYQWNLIQLVFPMVLVWEPVV